jgi:hypothetical protein
LAEFSKSQALLDYYRCPEYAAGFAVRGNAHPNGSPFSGQHSTVFTNSRDGAASNGSGQRVVDVAALGQVENGRCVLPFHPDELVENLRQERYVRTHGPQSAFRRLGKAAYYALRPIIPFAARSYLKRLVVKGWKQNAFPSWPVDRTVDETLEKLLLMAMKAQGVSAVPFIWFWPRAYSGCVVMTHDVETSAGLDFCSNLMDLNDRYGIKSSFEIVPKERYLVPARLLQEIRDRDFEINVHDWNHDGRLFSERNLFLERAKEINEVAERWGALGFRSGALYRNLEWYDAFTFEYDLSVPNVGHLDPQPGGCCTIMPYFVGNILEIPLTAVQDYMLFHLLNDYSIELWKRQLATILEHHGMASFIVHPDYVIDSRPRSVYTELLHLLSSLRSEGNIWIALPGKVNRWWRDRSKMELVNENGRWEIEGPGKEDACLAYAIADGKRIRYELAQAAAVC